MSKTKATSRTLEAVHETACDLHDAGFIDMRSMRRYDALRLEPIPAKNRVREQLLLILREIAL